MRFYKYLYVGETIKNVNLVKWKLKHAAGMLDVHLITISFNNDDQLDCFHNGLLKQKIFRNVDYYVVGIANGREEAISLIQEITNDCIEATGTGNIKQYLLDRF